MKTMINRLGPQSLRRYAAAFVAVIVFLLAGCGDGLGSGTNYFEFDGATGTITGYDDDGPKDVTLPSNINGIKVTAIGKNAFRGRQLTGVSILTSITTIGEGAFADNRLTGAVIRDSVITIRASAFEDNLLTDVVIPNSVTSIGAQAFANNRLTGVTIGGGVISIGKEAFAVNQLSGVDIPDSVTSIGEDAFSGNQLTSVTIGANKSYAFYIVPDFGTVYNGGGKRAGTYTLAGTTWTKQ
jgi:hypothetical protein